MTSVSNDSSKLKFSVERILSASGVGSECVKSEAGGARDEAPCAGCVAALYRCCRDEPVLPVPLPLAYTHFHPALRPTTGGYAKLQEGVLFGSDIHKLIFGSSFKITMNTKEKEAWSLVSKKL
ncbi:hypothetical protein EVAR_26519_1 [Eumeta japonica]|uniref:Uncharacterized protein n=1 Tax=Eumeta variegata TaxID=151549 RepID=A0A4C1V7S4_EUMVA|nr:hypothetical protein EVAR_26519_1 [Eumeta japonica]